MGQALYRSHRPKKLSEVLGQEHITDTLDAALKAGRISHAYLFTGPRGVGKTSIARILAHEINGLPYDSDQSHLDIIEIDAASNRRIDEIRELRDKVAIAPSGAKYKVYIIDEVHMLTREAFNALLKTLEEPPAHVVFILATTDAHKLPETIVSRTQRYSFKPVTLSKVAAHLRAIADQEKIDINDEALALLAEHGEGSFRDSISMLDQAGSSSEPVTKATVELLLGIPSDSAITELVTQLSGGSSKTVAEALTALSEQGYQASGVASAIARKVRQQIIDNSGGLQPDAAFALLDELLEVPSAHDQDRKLELAVLRSVRGTQPQPAPAVVVAAPQQVAAPTKPAKATPAPITPVEVAPPAVEPVEALKETVIAEVTLTTDQELPEEVQAAVESAVDANLWPEILSQLKQQYNTLYGVVRMAEPRFEGDTLSLAFAFAFHQKRLSEPKNKKIIADIIQQLSGQAIQINCIVEKTAKPAPAGVPAPVKATTNDVSAISNIFGGGELL